MPIPPHDADLRQALGLPEQPLGRKRRRPLLWAALGVVLFATAAGWFAGNLRLAYRRSRFQQTAAELETAFTPEEVHGVLARLEEQRPALVEDPASRITMAAAYLQAAQMLPHQQPFLRQAADELAAAAGTTDDHLPADVQHSLLQLETWVFPELERDAEALAALGRLERLLEEHGARIPRSLWIQHDNNLAYLLARSRDPAVGDPARALALAKGVIASTTPVEGRLPTDVAAYLDTLAEAYCASGNPAQALLIQRSALALAEGEGLAVYLEHYDTYREAADKR